MGAWQEIVDYTVPSNTTSVVLDSFGTITKDDFVKVEITHFDTSSVGAGNELRLFPNNDTTLTNYYYQALLGTGTSVAAARGNRQVIADTSVGEKNFILGYLKLSENDKYNLFCTSHKNLSGTTTQVQFFYLTSTTSYSSGITSLTFQGERANGLGTGSRIQIYKLAAEKVADITVASNTTQVDISNLSIDKDSEYLLVSDISNASASQTINLEMFVNDNTTSTNYYSQRIIGINTSASASRSNAPLFLQISGNLKGMSYSHIKLSNIGAYTSQNYGIRNYGGTSPDVWNQFISSTAENITSITKLNIKASETSSIAAGSTFVLYKLY